MPYITVADKCNVAALSFMMLEKNKLDKSNVVKFDWNETLDNCSSMVHC